MQVVNFVVMNHVTIGGFCSIQVSVICSNVQLQERAILAESSENLRMENAALKVQG
jgi:translation initiation factor eIF-2B subunit gamma